MTSQEIDVLLATQQPYETSKQHIERWCEAVNTLYKEKLTKEQEDRLYFIQYKLDDWESDYEITE